MSAPRGLTPEERAAWERLAATVTPLRPAPPPNSPPAPPAGARGEPRTGKGVAAGRDKAKGAAPPVPAPGPPRPTPAARTGMAASPPRTAPAPPGADREAGLDSHWDRRFRAGSIAPDFTLDLHGHTLDSAHARLDDGLMQAKAMGARVVLLIAGRPRPVDAADRGSRRGAIRAKVLDWLAAGPHGTDIAAIRKAHRRHGGEGALYLVLKRRR